MTKTQLGTTSVGGAAIEGATRVDEGGPAGGGCDGAGAREERREGGLHIVPPDGVNGGDPGQGDDGCSWVRIDIDANWAAYRLSLIRTLRDFGAQLAARHAEAALASLRSRPEQFDRRWPAVLPFLAHVSTVRADFEANQETYRRSLCRQLRTFGPDAEDAAQEALITLWATPTGYDPSRGSVIKYLSELALSAALGGRRQGDGREAREGKFGAGRLEPPSVEDGLERCPYGAELRTATAIARETFVWRKELARPEPARAPLWRHATERILRKDPTAVTYLVDVGLCRSVNAARTEKSRFLSALRDDLELLGLLSLGAGEPRPRGAIVILESLDEKGQVAARTYFSETCDLEKLSGLLDSGTRLVVVGAKRPPGRFRAPLTVVGSLGSSYVMDRRQRPLGTLWAALVEKGRSTIGWVIGPSPVAGRGARCR